MAVDETIKKIEIEGALVINRTTFPDERGFFKETFRLNDLEEAAGVEFKIQQQNHSRSTKGTLRGIHIAPWNKLVYCARGKVLEVIVDLREGSPTFGKHFEIEIGEDNKVAVFIPKGCGNAFQVVSDEADYTYLTDDYWYPDSEYGIAWDDPDLKINWPITPPLVSERDENSQTIKERFNKE